MATSKKEQILASALCLFSANGIDATSTASIAKAANVATGTLFHHFPNKEALVHQLYLATKHDLSQQLTNLDYDGADLKTISAAIWEEALNWAIKAPEKLKFFQLVAASQLLSSREQTQAMMQELNIIIRLIEQGQASGLFANHPIELVALNCQGQFFSASNFFIDNPQYFEEKSYRLASFTMFWNALLP